MPIRLRARPVAAAVRDMSPMSVRLDFDLPDVDDGDSFAQVAAKLSCYFVDALELPSTFEQLRTTPAGNCVRVLVDHLAATCRNPATVHALLALKWHYAADIEHRGLSETRSDACEIVAWRFLARLSERDAMDFCLYEIPDARQADADADADARRASSRRPSAAASPSPRPRSSRYSRQPAETSPLLPLAFDSPRGDALALPAGSATKKANMENSLGRLAHDVAGDPTSAFKGLNALEIAAIAGAKRFLSQHAVQKIVSGIWHGDIIFWDSLSVQTTKQHAYYDADTSDPFSRLRVPKYLKSWEVLFFAIFLCLYYAVLVARVETHLTATEITLLIWIAAFAYDEWSEWMDAGSIFYATDIWNVFDMIMILIGFVFAGLRIVGQIRSDTKLIGLAFDILSLEALFMMPRICSILSLSPYWGTLIPCLKEMGKDFIKFMVLVVIIYLGFLTTFSLVGRDTFNLSKMAGILTSIFFGSSYVGLDIMSEIDPFFGPPLMIVFVTLTSILLTGSLTGMLSNSFSRVITHAKEEYLYVYSVYVMEACTSNRLTHFYPPFNLIALVIFRPLRLVFARDEKFRAGRIALLKATHLPIVAAIKLYELFRKKLGHDKYVALRGDAGAKRRDERMLLPRGRPLSGHSRHQQWRDMAPPRPDDKHDDDDVETQTGVEVQVAEMSRKIDKLTALVLELQAKQDAPARADEA